MGTDNSALFALLDSIRPKLQEGTVSTEINA